MARAALSVLLGFLLLAGGSGCTKTFRIQPVALPQNVYGPAVAAEPSTLTVTDARGDKQLNTGTLNVQLTGMGDEIIYLADNLARVLAAEGIRVTSGPADAQLNLEVRKYRIRNLRTSGYSPYHSFTTFRGDLTVGGRTHPITAYFKGSKTPVWAFVEVERPCYQIPIEAVVKEIAAKINRVAFGRVTPTDAVERMAAAIPADRADSSTEAYLKVLELGYTNNPAAVPALVEISSRKEVLMRASAISALGTLGAKDQLPLLVKIYERDRDLGRAMALKSIGDIGTPEALAFLEGVVHSDAYRDEELKEVLDLYF